MVGKIISHHRILVKIVKGGMNVVLSKSKKIWLFMKLSQMIIILKMAIFSVSNRTMFVWFCL